MTGFASEKQFDYNEESTVNLLYCGLRENCLGHKYAPHIRDNHILTLISGGTATFDINGEKIRLSENYFYVMFSECGISYETLPDTPWSIYWLVTDGIQIEQILSGMGITREKPYIYINNPQKLKSIYNEIYEKINREDIVSKMECKSLLYSLFASVAEETAHLNGNSHVDTALRYIHRNYCDNISVNGISKAISLNPNYFSKLFKQNTGMTPNAYINSLRIKKAKFLLKNTDMKISDISKTVGFDDAFYFSRIFKKSENISPNEYRTQ
ncbi:MAG: AraC family transcriptional regulator [Clostridia bacterium]|nr:AraC family transcriptional regulator [Clostridia bacterium]